MHTKPYAPLNNFSQDTLDRAIDAVAHTHAYKWFTLYPFATEDLRAILASPAPAVEKCVNQLRDNFILAHLVQIGAECARIESKRETSQ